MTDVDVHKQVVVPREHFPRHLSTGLLLRVGEERVPRIGAMSSLNRLLGEKRE